MALEDPLWMWMSGNLANAVPFFLGELGGYGKSRRFFSNNAHFDSFCVKRLVPVDDEVG
jgi:hypothetical protein